MKITTLILAISVLSVDASVYSQNAVFSLQETEKPLREILKTIENSSEFRFFFNDEFADLNKIVSIEYKEKEINEILNSLFTDSDVTYQILENNVVVITPLKERFLQQLRVTGIVTDANTGERLPGVTIQVKGTMAGTITQTDGAYVINLPEGATTLIFSSIGYTTQEIEVSGRTTIDVVLNEEVTALEEVVVTGYSVERKKDIIGSVSIAATDDLQSRATGSMTSQLEGRVAGLTVASSGDMGGAAKVVIRGFGSFGNSTPLYIIDGMPGTIDRLNPSDIESVQVLKDAASASVYGARAASGVIIVTTKQGKQGAVKVDYNSYYAFNYWNEFPDLLNSEEMGDFIWKSMSGAGRHYGDANWNDLQYGNGTDPVIPEYILVNDATQGMLGGAELERIRVDDPTRFADMVNPDNYDYATHQIVRSADTDWFDEMFNPAPVQSHQLTASGGSDRGTFMLGLNYFNQGSEIDPYSYLKRAYIRVNTSMNILKFIRVGENLQVRYQKSLDVGSVQSAWSVHPLMPVWDIAGNPTGGAAPGLQSGPTGNPIGQAWHNRYDGNDSYGFFGNVFAEISLFKDLIGRSSFGMDYNNTNSQDLTQLTYENATNTTQNLLTWGMNQDRSWTLTNTLTYTKILGKNNFKILLGSEAIEDFGRNVTATRYDIAQEENLDFQVIDAGAGAQSNTGTKRRNTLFSLFGRFDYNFEDKYIVNLTLRRDGSSKFGINNRYGYFPAAAIGWRVTQENFMSGLSWLSDLKVRASYGIIGNQSGLPSENQYTIFRTTDANSYPIAGLNNTHVKSYAVSSLGNPDARWEKTATTNIGFDASLFTNSLMVNFDYFIRNTTDLLVTNQAPLTYSNATQPQINVGSVVNRGIELNVVYRGRIAERVGYEATVNFSKYKNEVTKVLDNEAATLNGASSRFGQITITKKGYPISMMYGYVIDGFFNSQEEVDAYKAGGTTTWLTPAIGRWRIKDINGDNKINDNDRTYIGSPHADFQTSLNLELTYKNFDLTGFVFWSQGGELFNQNLWYTDFMTFIFRRSHTYLYESWTPELKDKAKLPKLDINDAVSSSNTTNYPVQDATYIRLKNLMLGYNFPPSLLSKIKISNLRLYISAQNIWTWKKEYTGLDPAQAIRGSSDLSMGMISGERPSPKQILFGINLGF